MFTTLFRSGALLLLLTLPWLWLPACAKTAAQASMEVPALRLDPQAGVIDAWPVVTTLSDPSHELTLSQVLARRAEFEPPDAAYANLGVRRDAVWLKVPVSVPAQGEARWVLDIDYAPLTRVDVHVLSQGQVVAQAALGTGVPMAERPLATRESRTPAMLLDLQAGQSYELLVRVDTLSSAILPISLVQEVVYRQQEAATQMLQGLLAGIGLCLLMYCMGQWFSLRDRVFVYYAVVVFGSVTFFACYFGIASLYLWPGHAWLAVNGGPLTVLVALAGGFLFTERVLDVRQLQPRLGAALMAGSAIAALTALAFAAGWVGYRTAQTMASALGPFPMVLAMPAAFRRSRSGDPVAQFVLVGWSMYALSTLVIVGLLRGVLPSNFWTQHAFQFGSLFEMFIWLHVLGLRMEEVRQTAQRATLERDALHKLAHTDPLTGLPNRRGLNDALAPALRQCSPNHLVAVYLLDLDGFKPVNDRLGHDVGDAVLIDVGRRLKAHLRASDTVARLGGDEFVVMAIGLASDAEAQRLGQKLLTAFERPFIQGPHQCSVGLTIGYALAPLDGQDGAILLQRADAAMYAGKQAGKHCLRRGGAAMVGLARA